jgi:galactose mutarotase-like enzyme
MPRILAPALLTVRGTTVDGLDAVTLAAGALEATFVPAVGMVGTSLRHDGEELLSSEAGVAAYAAQGTVLGIPFLHPWANRLEAAADPDGDLPRDRAGLPIHGVLPRRFHLSRAGTTATMRFGGHPAFPHPHRVVQRIALDARALRITTTVHADRGAPVPVAFGFHPYLRLPGVARADVVLSLPARRHLRADARMLPTGAVAFPPAETAPLGARALDDSYDALGPEPALTIAGGGRTVSVRLLDGYRVAQVYAPVDEDVVCLEPMTAQTNALVSRRGLHTVAPGDAFTASFAIEIEEL